MPSEKTEAFEPYKKLMYVVNPLSFLIIDAAEKAFGLNKPKSKEATTSELQTEVLRSEFQAKILIAQAKVAQEMAITRRIEMAYEVTIEEYFDGAGERSVGVNVNPEVLNIGLHGSGHRVTKRIYTFKGWHDGSMITESSVSL